MKIQVKTIILYFFNVAKQFYLEVLLKYCYKEKKIICRKQGPEKIVKF